MLWSRVDRFYRANLNDVAEIHHQDPITDELHDVQIMRDEQIRQVQLLLQLHEEIQHLRFDRFIEGRNGLIENDQARSQSQGTGNVHALLLPTGEFVRIARPEQLRVKANCPQEVTCQGSGRRGFGAMHARSVGDGVMDWHTRVERGVRVLEDHLDIATEFPQRYTVPGLYCLTIKNELPRVRLHEMQY